MRRRRIAFMLRAMTMAAPSFTTMCGDRTHTPEAAQPTPTPTEGSAAARLAGQPTGGIMVKRGQTPPLRDRNEAGTSQREGVASTVPAGAK